MTIAITLLFAHLLVIFLLMSALFKFTPIGNIYVLVKEHKYFITLIVSISEIGIHYIHIHVHIFMYITETVDDRL